MTPLLLAIQFLTILPVRVGSKIRDGDLARSVGYYPLIGAFLGLISAGVYVVSLQWMGISVAMVSAIVILIVLSGALHLDGFADMCDGFYAGKNKEGILAIMKDPHCGPMAVVGLVCLLALKLACLAAVPTVLTLRALIIAPALGRWSMAYLCAFSTYARESGGTARPFIGQVQKWDLAKAALLALLISWLALREIGLALFAAATLSAWIFKRWVTRRIGGMTGDTLGAASEVVEVLVLGLLSIHPAGFGV